MLKKYASVTLIVLIMNLAFSSFGLAQDNEAAGKMKVKVAKFGTGGRQTEVKYKDRTKIKGYITEIKDDYFVVVAKEDGATVRVPYDKVSSIRRYKSLNIFTKIAIGTGIVIGVMFAIVGICLAAKSCTE